MRVYFCFDKSFKVYSSNVTVTMSIKVIVDVQNYGNGNEHLDGQNGVAHPFCLSKYPSMGGFGAWANFVFG